jgi:hypothetical protein
MSYYQSVYFVDWFKVKEPNLFLSFLKEVQEYSSYFEFHQDGNEFQIKAVDEPAHKLVDGEEVGIDFETELEKYIDGVTVIKSVGFDEKHCGMHAYMVILEPGKDSTVRSMAIWEEELRCRLSQT